MKMVAETISGYTYGADTVAASPVTMEELARLKVTVGWTDEDQHYLRMAGEVLGDQTAAIVKHWRSGIIASIPHLAMHSRSVDGEALPDYLGKSNLRFEQWILDTCLRPYDQAWLNYQQEIALRHTALKKNVTDGAPSTSHVPLRDILAFAAVINQTIKPYLAAKGHASDEVVKMHTAWCRSVQLQLALWAQPYADAKQAAGEW